MYVVREDDRIVLVGKDVRIVLTEEQALILADSICGKVQELRRKYGKRD